MKKLLIIGSNTIHTYNYINLIKDYFDEILLVTNIKNENYAANSIEINFSLILNIFSSVKKIVKIVKKFEPSVIHIHQANSYAFISLLATKNMNVPKVLTAWGSDILVNPKKNFLLKKIVSFNLSHVNIATSDSMYMASEMKSYTHKVDVRIANFGIEENKNKNINKEKIIYSNRLHKSLYNVDSVIYTFNKFVKKNPEWKLVIGAIGDETEKLRQLVLDLHLEDKVEFIGWVNSKINNEYYEKASIYISIPSSDATAISLLEAISYNCICFVSNLPANGEHILDGINGFIEPNLDKIDLEKFEVIDTQLLKDVNFRRKNSYLKDTNRKKFIAIYDELIGENK